MEYRGKVRLVYKDFPLPGGRGKFHRTAEQSEFFAAGVFDADEHSP